MIRTSSGDWLYADIPWAMHVQLLRLEIEWQLTSWQALIDGTEVEWN